MTQIKQIYLILFILLLFPDRSHATEDPDDLYRQGRFKEAEAAYAQKDMDHPKDIRYRYNKGCAAYQNADLQGAAAAFSSVLKRTTDDDVRFRTVFNLGNTAFTQGDFQSAVEYYRQAILLKPENEDARYNLELALKERQKQKEEESSRHQEEDQEDDSGQKGEHGSDDQNQDQQQQEQPSDQTDKGDRENQTSQDQDGKDQKGESEPGDTSGQDQDQRAGTENPEDLSGDLKSSQQMPGQGQEDKQENSPTTMMERKKAEALLDNIREDPSRILRFQIPEENRHGISSGKDW
ncbi:MAG: tetratricopeptide repeat protein [Deltaproteobacteria bacterium]|nr:tetratricopeptide repeat protein [Deltaproteobacteria bacterium]